MRILLVLATASLSSLLLVINALADPVSAYNQNLSGRNSSYDMQYNQALESNDESNSDSIKNPTRGRVSGSAQQIRNVVITGNKSIPSDKLRSAIAPYLAGTMTPDKTVKVRDAVEEYYKKAGYFLPVAQVRASNGTLFIKVIEGKVKEVIVVLEDKLRDGNVLRNSQFLQLVEKIEKASPLRTRKLEEYLLLINKIHGYNADYDLQPLSSPEGNAVANLVINVSTERGQIDLSADNNGLKEMGRYEFFAGTQFYNVISNDSMILNGALSDKHNKFQMFSGGYLKRLKPGTSLSGLASFIKDQPYPGAGSISSTTISYKGRFDQYLVINDDYSVKLEIGLEERDLVYYDQAVKYNDYYYFLGSIGGKIKINDPANGENWIYPYYNHTLKKAVYKKNSAQVQNFDGNFGFFMVDWYRTQQLSDKFSFLVKASYQGTNDQLPTDQQYAIGTQHTIRGYTIGMVASNQGVSGELEVRYTHNLQGAYKQFLETLQAFGFYGATHFIAHNKNINSTSNLGNIYFDKSTLQSAGGGLRFSFPYKIYGEAIAAQPLTRHINVNGISKTNSTIYSFLVSKNFSW